MVAVDHLPVLAQADATAPEIELGSYQQPHHFVERCPFGRISPQRYQAARLVPDMRPSGRNWAAHLVLDIRPSGRISQR